MLKTIGIITLVRFPPNSPFALTNLALSTCGTKLGPYALGTLIGMTPRTAVAVGFAAWGADQGAKDLQTFIKDGPGPYVLVGGIILMVIVLMVISHIANKALAKFDDPTGAATTD